MPKHRSFVPWIPRLIILAGIALLVIAVLVGRDSWSLRSQDTKVTGTIVEIDTTGEGSRLATWEFEHDGETYRHEGSANATSKTEYEGATDELYIDPDNPEKAKVAGFTGMWLIPTVFVVLGIATLFAGIVTWIVMRIVRATRGRLDGHQETAMSTSRTDSAIHR